MCIRIVDSASVPIGELRPLSEREIESEEFLQLLALSRNSYKGSFLTNSTSDVNTTRRFLEDCLKSRTKHFFLIYIYRDSSENSYLYGHLGYEIVDSKRIEVVNVMKIVGLQTSVRMSQPLAALLSYLQGNFPKSEIFLKVLKSNARAISMYSHCGFRTSTKESTDQFLIMIL